MDLIFTKAKPKFERRLDFKHFLDALAAMSAKKYPRLEAGTGFSKVLAHHVFQLPCVTHGGIDAQAEEARAPRGTCLNCFTWVSRRPSTRDARAWGSCC